MTFKRFYFLTSINNFIKTTRFFQILRCMESIFALAGVLSSLYPLSKYIGGSFVLIALGCALFLRIGMLSMKKVYTGRKNSEYWIISCNLGSVLITLFACLCLMMATTGITTHSSLCQAFVGYGLSLLLIADSVLSKNKRS